MHLTLLTSKLADVWCVLTVDMQKPESRARYGKNRFQLSTYILRAILLSYIPTYCSSSYEVHLYMYISRFPYVFRINENNFTVVIFHLSCLFLFFKVPNTCILKIFCPQNLHTLWTRIIVTRTFINFRSFSQPYGPYSRRYVY